VTSVPYRVAGLVGSYRDANIWNYWNGKVGEVGTVHIMVARGGCADIAALILNRKIIWSCVVCFMA